uniref:Prefoldin subunit 4 n=1 Tax=Micromonas pusilla TaxID=38833 RepID=A0A7S0DD37_MICPS|mmetsp:Transcript_9186/g.38906  ORF Transcript_9186/g.38906 Transcript_9186/m.38906 type:complete len:124 (+) Transcript_9186:42-413(+)
MSEGKAEEVTWEDQQHICAFGRFNTRVHEVNAELRAKAKMAEDLEEASNELIVTDEDAVRFGVGETFVLVENDDAESMLDTLLGETKKEVDALEAEKKELQGAMAELKEKLYKKFGNSINLEE